jgi:hypothetical protein
VNTPQYAEFLRPEKYKMSLIAQGSGQNENKPTNKNLQAM